MDLQIASLICLRHVNDGNSSMQFTKPANRSTGVVSQTSINILDGVLCKNYCEFLHLRCLRGSLIASGYSAKVLEAVETCQSIEGY